MRKYDNKCRDENGNQRIVFHDLIPCWRVCAVAATMKQFAAVSPSLCQNAFRCSAERNEGHPVFVFENQGVVERRRDVNHPSSTDVVNFLQGVNDTSRHRM